MKIKSILLTMLSLLLYTSLFALEVYIPFFANSLDIADFDLDGDLDVVVGHQTGWDDTNTTITLIENLNNCEYSVIDTSIVFCGRQNRIMFAKMNYDDYPDIVALYAENPELFIRIFYNDNGEFDSYSDYPIEREISIYLESGDLNSDGIDDIVVSSSTSGNLGILESEGAYSFSEPEYFQYQTPLFLSIGDILGDEQNEILGSGYPVTIFYKNQEEWHSTPFGVDVFTDQAQIADMNNDGINEVITYKLPLFGDDCYLKIFSREGDEFEIVFERTYSFPSALNIVDVNADGLPDFILGGKVVINRGGYSFDDPYDVFTAYYASWFSYADMDGNGFDDIVSCGRIPSLMTGVFTIAFNDGNGHFLENPQTENLIDESPVSNFNLRNYPNPFNPETIISFETSNNIENAIIEIFNVKGQRIRQLIINNSQLIINEVVWNGEDKFQKQVPSGIYYYRIKADGFLSESKKMILIK